MKRMIAICAAAMLVAATPVNAQRANPEGQSWDSDYTAREWLKDCTNRANKCRFFILTVAQASYWCEKCIPSMTSLTEVEEVMRARSLHKIRNTWTVLQLTSYSLQSTQDGHVKAVNACGEPQCPATAQSSSAILDQVETEKPPPVAEGGDLVRH
jgi:hypothetical protein